MSDQYATPAEPPEDITKAAAEGDVETLRTWLDAGGDPSAVDAVGASLLIYAISSLPAGSFFGRLHNRRFFNTDAIYLLVERGADVNHASIKGWTALHFAANDPATILDDVISLLLKHGAAQTIDSLAPCGETPLLFAAVNSRCEAVSMLLRWGASPWGPGAEAEQVRALRRQSGLSEQASDLWFSPLAQLAHKRGNDRLSESRDTAVALIRGVREFGSWHAFVHPPRVRLFLLRKLCDLGPDRAAPPPDGILASLFSSSSLPDAVFCLILEFWPQHLAVAVPGYERRPSGWNW